MLGQRSRPRVLHVRGCAQDAWGKYPFPCGSLLFTLGSLLLFDRGRAKKRPTSDSFSLSRFFFEIFNGLPPRLIADKRCRVLSPSVCSAQDRVMSVSATQSRASRAHFNGGVASSVGAKRTNALPGLAQGVSSPFSHRRPRSMSRRTISPLSPFRPLIATKSAAFASGSIDET